MKKIMLILGVVICFASAGLCEDNLSILGGFGKKSKDKTEPVKQAGEADNPLPQIQEVKKEAQTKEAEEKTFQEDKMDDTDRRVEDMKTYHDILDNKQKEIDIIKLDLEKQKLLLEKKEAQKKIQDISAGLPAGEKMENASMLIKQKVELTKQAGEEDIKILLLVLADNLKEAIVSAGGRQSTVYEGTKIAEGITVESINKTGVVFKRENGDIFVRNFIE